MKKVAVILLTSTVAIGFSLFVRGQETGKNPHGEIGRDCQICHSVESWKILKKPLEFQHSSTGFALVGAHESANCLGCHRDLRFANVGVECVDCHTDVHRNQFGVECRNCHTPHSWQNRQDLLELHASRGFSLVGVHAIVDCDACHIRQGREEFSGTPLDCEGCHLENFTSARNPDHVMAGFAGDCQACHPAVAPNWRSTTFQHSGAFQMRGAHLGVDCVGCHAENYAGTSQLCFGCHESDFSAAIEPDHSGLGFPTNCEICHEEVSWQGARFDHLASTGFELRGAHMLIDCVGCHVENQIDLPRDCIGCHQDDYEGVSDPNHVEGDFPQDCTFCHGDNAWSPAQFDHNQTAFPLTGAHQTLVCEACHINGQFGGTPTDCLACHESDYNNVQDPNHVSNNFSTDCTQCHTTVGWLPVSFDHAQTQFPLTGAHLGLECISCHAGGYDNTPTDCFACHDSDYNNVQDPNHVSNNFSTDCTQCHTTSGWLPVSFDHAQTQFPLTGAHLGLECILCHAGGYDNTPTDCYACHQGDYNGTVDPDHQQLGFPTNCELCHNTGGWETSWNHDAQYFPIFSGRHEGRWNICADCHVIPDDFGAFECIFCHEHNQQDTDERHQEVPGYAYNSQACYSCHPDGERP